MENANLPTVSDERIKEIVELWRSNGNKPDITMTSAELEACIHTLRGKLDKLYGRNVIIAPRCGLCFRRQTDHVAIIRCHSDDKLGMTPYMTSMLEEIDMASRILQNTEMGMEVEVLKGQLVEKEIEMEDKTDRMTKFIEKVESYARVRGRGDDEMEV